MKDTQQEAPSIGTQQMDEEKGECLMCKFVLGFSFIALLLVFVLVFIMRVPAAGGGGF